MVCKKIDNLIMEKRHIPVLLKELLRSIKIKKVKKNIIVDCTLWIAGHAIEIIKKMNPGDKFIWFEIDIKNLFLAKKRLKERFWENIFFCNSGLNSKSLEKNEFNTKKDSKLSSKRDTSKINIVLLNTNFVNLKDRLKELKIEKITSIYYDLWLSSLHLDEASRWFSFMLNWPLDMRLDKTRWITAAKIVNSYSQSELKKIFLNYWEEIWANKIAANIVKIRKVKKKFETTLELANIIPWWPKTKSRIFQAIRIETNKELENLEKSLKNAIELLEKDWKIFVISFHSLEDRIVKSTFKKEAKDCICSDLICSCKHKKSLHIITKKPIIPTDEEIKNNSRSRSAKAREAKKI